MSETARITSRSTAAAGLAVALGTALGACGSSASSATPPPNTVTSIHGSVPLPTTSSAPTTTTSSAPIATTSSKTASTPSTPAAPSVPGGFLPQSALPDYPAYGWTKPDLNQVNVEHPLPDICGNSLGPQVTRGVREADYGSRSSDVTAVEDIYTYASAADANAQLKASLPTCGGISADSGNGFAWEGAGPGSTGLQHVLYLVQDNKIATLVVTPGHRDYSTTSDARLLKEMAAHLRNA